MNKRERIVFLVDVSLEMACEFHGEKTGNSRMFHVHRSILGYINVKRLVNSAHDYALAVLADSCFTIQEFTKDQNAMHKALTDIQPAAPLPSADISPFLNSLVQRVDSTSSIRVILFYCRHAKLAALSEAAITALQHPHFFVDVMNIGGDEMPEETAQSLAPLTVVGRSFHMRVASAAHISPALLRLVPHALQRTDPHAMHLNIEEEPVPQV